MALFYALSIAAVAVASDLPIPNSSTQPPIMDSAFETQKREEAQRIVDSIQLPQIPEGRTIELREFAALEPDAYGEQDFRPAMQKALDTLSEAGGGTLHISHPAGPSAWFKTPVTYRLSGPIQLRSRTRIALDRSVRLVFDFNPEAYSNQGRGYLMRYEGTLIYGPSACLRAFNVTDVEIVALPGSGVMPTIDGNGEKWQRWMWAKEFGPQSQVESERSYMRLKHQINNGRMPLAERRCGDVTEWALRPTLFESLFCSRIRLEGFELRQAPFWVVHPVYSTDLIFRDLKFECTCVNNDGIDPESCKRVLIERVMFHNYDDNVAIKSGRDQDAMQGVDLTGSEAEGIESDFIVDGRTRDHSSEIVIRNNYFKGHYAVCIGSEISGGASQIYVLDNIVPQDVKMLLNIKSSRSRGGIVEDIYVFGLKANHVTDAAFCLIPNYDNDLKSPYPPTYRNVFVKDIDIEKAGRGFLIHGWNETPINNIHFNNVSIETVTGAKFEISNAYDVTLSNVSIGDEQLDGSYKHEDASVTPPYQN